MPFVIELTVVLRRKRITYPLGCQFKATAIDKSKLTTLAVDPWGNTVRLPTRLVRVVKSITATKPKRTPALAELIDSGTITKGLR